MIAAASRAFAAVAAAGLAGACAQPHERTPAEARVVLTAPPTLNCQAARDADFENAGAAELRGYLDWLARTHGAPAKLTSPQVTLAIVRGAAKPGPTGVQVGEISCNADNYRITLYRDALAGRPLTVAYHTLAHEFHHVVQIRRDRLACEAGGGRREAYEREADEFARRVLPACAKGKKK